MDWKEKLRDFQNHCNDEGWRIPTITGSSSSVPLKRSNSKLAILLGFVGLFCVMGSVVGMVFMHDESEQPPLFYLLPVFVAGICLMCGSKVVNYLVKRRSWHFVEGICRDSEIRLVSARRKKQWGLRVLCEFEMNGTKISCTPITNWIGLGGRSAAEKFLAKRIGEDGKCTLLVNPENNYESELLKRSSARWQCPMSC